MSAVIL